ncbi:MAG: hypothetical protein GKR94_31430 [Gammaproteobacteria bacterium]|nr:hypothetical protein [Gammaproteobacteria bacterium]
MLVKFRDLLAHNVPTELLSRLQQEVPRIYPAAYERAHSDHPEPQAQNLVGNIRSAMVDAALFRLGQLTARVDVETRTVGGWNYTLLRAGRLLLTAARADGKGLPPRDCSYRRGYAALNQGQGDLLYSRFTPEELGIEFGPDPNFDAYCC